MEAKKTPKADLEKRRGLYLEIGLVVILAAALVAFNIKSYDKEEKVVNTRTAESEIDVEILNTQEEETPPPPPEEPEVVATDLNVVENDAQDIEEVGIINAGDDANKGADRITNVVVEVEEEVQEEEDEVFIVVEEDPEFPGGLQALSQFIADNIKYPQLAKENNITGRVFVSFVVEKDGRVGQVKILRDIGGGCGNEAVRVVKLMPKWKPGKQRGKPVRTQFNLPVNFDLQ
jgi:protein TonB